MDTCALCKAETVLRESHFIPKALYRLARADTPKGNSPNPILVSPNGTVQTSLQITCRLLCDQCEQRFSERGEKAVINECLRGEGNFILRDKLRCIRPTLSNEQISLFSGGALTNVDVASYRYFAASMFWRGSVGRWTTQGSSEWRGSLGLYFQEEFRKFLYDEGPFPSGALLTFFAANEKEPHGFSTVTATHKYNSFHTHKFFIPGLEIRMYLGSKIDTEVRAFFDTWGTNVMFVLQDSHTSRSFKQFVEMVQKSPVRGKLGN